MVDVVRGVLRVRKWPRKRGTPAHPTTLWWNDWFRQANFLAKYADAMSMRRAIEMTAGSPLYPRDVLLSAMRGRLYSWVDDTGWKWYSVAAIGDISESLDVLAQTIGSVLVRATDRWRSPAPGTIGDRLTYQGPNAAPDWQPGGGGGGVEQVVLSGSPVVPDDTVDEYIFPISTYAEIFITLDAVGFASAAYCIARFSTDGGVTYKSAGTDYKHQTVTPSNASNGNTSGFLLGAGNGPTAHNVTAHLTSLRVGRASYLASTNLATSTGSLRGGFANFDGPITHMKLVSNTGTNFDAGTIRLAGTIAA